MGGDNQSTLAKDPPKAESILPADQPEEILNMASSPEAAQRDKKRKTDKSKKKPKQPKKPKKPKAQTQEFRQHVNKGECHWHDDAGGLKAAIPVADWFGMVRRLKQMETVEYVDMTNMTHISFHPFIEDGELQLVTQLESIKITPRFTQVADLAQTGSK